MALELGACVSHCVPRKIFKHLLDFGFGVAGKGVIFFNYIPQIIIHNFAISRVKMPDIITGKVVNI